MTPEQIAAAVIAAAKLLETLSAIAKEDPAVWERVQGDYNRAVDAFKATV